MNLKNVLYVFKMSTYLIEHLVDTQSVWIATTSIRPRERPKTERVLYAAWYCLNTGLEAPLRLDIRMLEIPEVPLKEEGGMLRQLNKS